MVEDKILCSYDIVNEFSGHQPNRDVPVAEAAREIFKECKEKAKELAFNSKFVEFSSIDELIEKLKSAVKSGFSIRVLDANVGG